jgi:hypothetical protein
MDGVGGGIMHVVVIFGRCLKFFFSPPAPNFLMLHQLQYSQEGFNKSEKKIFKKNLNAPNLKSKLKCGKFSLSFFFQNLKIIFIFIVCMLSCGVLHHNRFVGGFCWHGITAFVQSWQVTSCSRPVPGRPTHSVQWHLIAHQLCPIAWLGQTHTAQLFPITGLLEPCA